MAKKKIEVVVKDTVGVTFRIEKGQRKPKKGGTVSLRVGRTEIALVVRHTTKRKDGAVTVWAFVRKGEGDGVRLAKSRGKAGTLSY